MDTLQFHVGLAPYVDGSGTKQASYQLLSGRAAVATLEMSGAGMITLRALPGLPLAEFIRNARQHYRDTKPIVFAPAYPKGRWT